MKNKSELIERIIRLLNDNFVVYIQRDTNKIVAFPEMGEVMDFMDFGDDNYELLYHEVESHPDNFFKIEPLTSRELYNVMMDFATEQERVDSIRLVKALRTKTPIPQFNNEVVKMGPEMLASWQDYYSDQLRIILRSRFCKERIHIFSENCN
ncbi:UPF0158 family protein [Carboxylicivirga taeanensis]|uniref:UPF0158 family protein n=1 Tax=Carboxylicivirga taeanensis TaxID=1416875 RepID=UPI003F6E2D23